MGLFAGYQLAASLVVTIPIAIGPFTFVTWIVILSLAVGFGVPLLAALLPLWNGTRISVRDALAAYGVSAEQGNGPLTRLSRRPGRDRPVSVPSTSGRRLKLLRFKQ